MCVGVCLCGCEELWRSQSERESEGGVSAVRAGRERDRERDLLDIAVEEVREEEREREREAEIEEKMHRIAIVEEEEPENAGEGAEVATITTSAQETSVDDERDRVQEEEKRNKEQEEKEERARREAEEVAERAAREEREREAHEERERQQRVQDSLAIYKQQLRESKARENDPTAAAAAVPCTWQVAARIEEEEERPLYWTETMDLSLAKAVQECVFDFAAIAERLQALALEKHLDSHAAHARPQALSEDVCRLRWSQLDANQWCVPAPGVTAQDTIFRVNLSDEILRQTAGQQPSFEQLRGLAKSDKPSYLKTPTVFPSVEKHLVDEDDEEEDADSA